MAIRRLEPRLELIWRWCRDFSVIADIGAHHGQLAQHLALEGHAVIATERSWSGFQQLQERMARWPVDVRRGNGLESVLNDQVDVVVVAGLGFDSILRIMDRASEMASRPLFIVQPMQGALVFRQALLRRRWTIVKAELTRYHNRFYATWLLNVYRVATAGELSVVAEEFLDSPWYAQWLQYDRRLTLD